MWILYGSRECLDYTEEGKGDEQVRAEREGSKSGRKKKEERKVGGVGSYVQLAEKV